MGFILSQMWDDRDTKNGSESLGVPIFTCAVSTFVFKGFMDELGYLTLIMDNDNGMIMDFVLIHKFW